MGIFDGQPVNAAATNPAFLSANEDDTEFGIITLSNTNPLSGAVITNMQGLINSLRITTGATETIAATGYSSTNRISGSHFAALNQLDTAFHAVTGHKHSGVPGDAPMIPASGISPITLMGMWRKAQFTVGSVTGSFADVGTNLSSFPVSSAINVPGIIVDPPYNYAMIRQVTGTPGQNFFDASGYAIYGRLTLSGAPPTGNYKLSFFGGPSGHPSTYSFSSPTNLTFFFQELVNPINETQVYSLLNEQFDIKPVVGSFAKQSSIPRYGNISLIPGTNITIADNGDGSYTLAASVSGGGSTTLNQTTKTSNYNIQTTDDVVYANASGGAFTLTLPSPSGSMGHPFYLEKFVEDNTFNQITIAGGPTGNFLSTAGERVIIISDGLIYNVLDRVIPSKWTSFPMTIGSVGTPPTKGTLAYDISLWRRSGDSIEVNSFYKQTGAGSSGSTDTYLFPLPSGCPAIASNKVGTTTGSFTQIQILGSGYVRTEVSSIEYTGLFSPAIWNSTNIFMTGGYFQDAGSNMTKSTFGQTFSLGDSGSLAFSFNYKVPITGWNG